MAIKDATLAAYFNGPNRSDIRSEKLALKASLWVNGTVVDQTSFDSTWTLGTGYCAIRMGAVRLFLESLKKTFKFNISLTKQMKASKCVSRRGKNISYKACVCNRTEHIQLKLKFMLYFDLISKVTNLYSLIFMTIFKKRIFRKKIFCGSRSSLSIFILLVYKSHNNTWMKKLNCLLFT